MAEIEPNPKSPISRLRFRHPWRPYQARVLKAIESHLEDEKLHLIAPPGSGKTILGLEIFRRLGKPALVLAPTRLIRDQWVQRLQDFLPKDSLGLVPWASNDLAKPNFFTAATYHSLHFLLGGGKKSANDGGKGPPKEAEFAVLLETLKQQQVQTLILDESHHLKAAWWASLSKLVQKIPGLVLVSLTATPPLDVKEFQWQKYLELCGSIDEEIAVPELVKARNLCPHQDFIWAVALPLSKQKELSAFAATISEFIETLDADLILLEAVLHHPWRTHLEIPPIQDMLACPELSYALMIYWRAKAMAFPRYLLEWLGEEVDKLPQLSAKWWQVLLSGYLFDSNWPHTPASKKHRDQLARRMRAGGLLYQREIRLVEAKPIKRMLSLSSAKMDGCVEIYQLERRLRGHQLRQVFLTDYIRDQVDVGDEASLAAGLGAWPLFYNLSINMPPAEQKRLALLTGRVSMMHHGLVEKLQVSKPGAFDVQPLAEHPDFVRLSGSTAWLSVIFTQWLASGTLHVLVGTRALLGEGWDAPFVNSLVLASFIGSFVTTNQMRGRAIRVDPNHSQKWASIWHLVTVAEDSQFGLLDFKDLERRFHTFVGLDADAPRIENSLQRLRLPCFSEGVFTQSQINIEENNHLMIKRLVAGHQLGDDWQEAIGSGGYKRMMPSVRSVTAPHVRAVFKQELVRTIWINMGLGIGVSLVWLGWFADYYGFWFTAVTTFILTSFWVSAKTALSALLSAITGLLRFGKPSGLIRQMARALRDALCETGQLKAPPEQYQIQYSLEGDRRVFVSLQGGDFYEQSLFADCLAALVSPPEKPRYLLEMQGPVWARAVHRVCYAVPKPLGTKKELARVLLKHWQARVGKASLVYTRIQEGRQRLLQVQLKTLLSVIEDQTARIDRWF